MVDLGGVTDLSEPAGCYAAWDAEPGNADKANAVLFGCHAPLPGGLPADRERNGVHDVVRQLLAIYTGVKHLVVVGRRPGRAAWRG